MSDDLRERFKQLDQQKKETAKREEERIEKEKRNRISNSALMRFYDFARGNRTDYTDEELAIIDSVDDPSLLDLDENGHLILRAKTPEEQARLEGQQNAQILKDLLREEKPVQTLKVEESAEILRIEDLDMSTARVYLGFGENAKTGETSCVFVIDQGYGLFRNVSIGGEKLHEKTKEDMAFRTLNAVLGRYAYAIQPINDVTLFMENELGWTIEQNSYESRTVFSDEAEAYERTFRRCIEKGMKISLAPAAGNSVYAELAQNTAAQLIKE